MRVALMVTCINDALFPDTGRAVVTLLRRLGVEVDFPEAQTCCGQPMINTGYLDEAVPPLRSFVKAFDGYDAIVTPSGSCAGSARHQHAIVAQRHFQRSGDPDLVAAVERTAPRTYELSEFLVDVLGVTDVGAYFPHRVTYHPTCHSLRMLGVGDRPTELLRAVRGLELVELPRAEECCGFGGTFAVKNSDTSVAMVSDKARHVRETGAEVLVAGDNCCLMNIGGTLTRAARRRTRHAPRRDPRRDGRRPMSATFVGMPKFPVAAKAALEDTQLRRNLAHATATIRDKRARVVAEVDELGGAAPGGCGDQGRRAVLPGRAARPPGGAADGRRGHRALGPRRRRGVRDRGRGREGPRHRRGREGQVDGHPGDRPQRGPRGARASPPGRPTWPS